MSVILFENKKQCCGCSACMNICNKQAISMYEDEYGYEYPKIDSSLCVECGLCKKVCSYQSQNIKKEVKKVYAAAAKDNNLIMKSASGGVFGELAKAIIEKGGVVYGAAMLVEDNMLVPKHIRVNKTEDLEKLQGSKYVQSSIGRAYTEVEKDLQKGETVLFSGTPCQVAGLKGYLRQDYEKLYTVDIICHGVPNAKMFNDYITECMNKYKCSIIDYKFRNKRKGWGLNASLTYQTYRGNIKIKLIPSGASSYYDMFLKSEIYRDNCYDCPYACGERVGDITLGDFWGIQHLHPNFMKANGGHFDEIKGVSCILVNTDRGEKIIGIVSGRIEYHSSDIRKVSSENGQLNHPSRCPETRKYILSLYKDGGWPKVEAYFKKRNGLRTYYCYMKNIMPQSLKNSLKKFLNR